MNKRRAFLKSVIGSFSAAGILLNPMASSLRWVYAKAQKTILPKDTKRENLIHRHPRTLDASNLEITPLKDFETMGTSDYEVNLEKWRLVITGGVKNPLSLNYSEIRKLPFIEKKILLICPGFFANHGQWKGISMPELLKKVIPDKRATHITFSGIDGSGEKSERFQIKELLQDRVFLAYGVNGQTLPIRNGFPLRVVAEDNYGGNWLKYVNKMTVEID